MKPLLLFLALCLLPFPTQAAVFGGEVALRGSLQQLSAQPRDYRNPKARKTADYLALCFKSIGLSPVRGAFIHAIPGGQNVFGLLKGKGPGVIVVQAHYDTEGQGQAAGDNTAGVASLLEMASILKGSGKLERSILFACFDGEEYGFMGARDFLRNPPVPLNTVDTFLAIDRIGHPFGGGPSWRLLVSGSEYCSSLRLALSTRPWFVQPVGDDLFGNRSSISLFREQRIPFLFFTNGPYPEVHGPEDVAERLDFRMMNEQVDFLSKLTISLANAPTRFRFTSFKKEVKDAPILAKMWEESNARLKMLPASYQGAVASLDRQLKEKRPNRSTLSRAYQLMETAATPWVIAEMDAAGEARNCERKNDKYGALQAYRKALRISRTKSAREWYLKRLKDLSQSNELNQTQEPRY